MDQRQIDDLWMRQEEVPGVSFKLNDPVEVTEGDLTGETGSLIALIELVPEPLYLVEMSNGSDIRLKESQLQGID